MKNCLLLFGLIFCWSVEVLAQTYDEKHFSGIYIGSEIGYYDGKDGIGGLSYGAALGIHGQSGGFVYGLEGRFGKAEAETGARVIFEGGEAVGAKVDYLWAITPTIVWVVGREGRGLLSVGVGYGKFSASTPVSGSVNVSSAETVTGFVGYEYALGSRSSLRLRVTTSEFDSYQATVGFVLRFQDLVTKYVSMRSLNLNSGGLC